MALTVAIACGGWFFGVVIGYLIGRLDWCAARIFQLRPASLPYETPPTIAGGQYIKARKRQKSELAELADAAAKIDIDSSKFVAPISTAGMQRVDTNQLGKTAEIPDNIQSSISKLSQMKGADNG